MGPIGEIHLPFYLRFLQTVFTRWQKSVNSTGEVIPSIHPLLRYHSYPKSAIGQAGFHQADTSCPIGQHTRTSASWSAQYLPKCGARIAILDFDVHHTNGPQGIFYDRNDIFTIIITCRSCALHSLF